MARKTQKSNTFPILINTQITIDQKIKLENLAIKTGKSMATHIREGLDMVFVKYGIKPSQPVEA